MLVTLLLPMLEVPGRPGAVVVPREALEIVGVEAEVGVGAGVETEEKKVTKRRMAKRQTPMPATETSMAVKEATQGATIVARSATKTVRCSGQVCSVCGGKGDSSKICANIVTVFACEADASGSDSDGVLSSEEQDLLRCTRQGFLQAW